MIKIIEDLWLKRRDIVSDGFDESLEYLSKIIPLKIHKVPSGTKCWTWTVPEKWTVKEAYIEDTGGRRLLDLKDHPLHVISYSLPVDEVVSRETLMKHLFTNPQMPDSIPFEYKYYQRDWGFCVQHNRLKDYTSAKYKVYIDSRFENGSLKVGECTVKGRSSETVVLVAHLCHPAMVNDDLTGVSVLVDLAKEISKRNNYYTYKFLLLPETIGSIAYLSQNEDVIKNLEYGIFLEMLGNDNVHALQRSLQGSTRLDRIARYVMKRRLSSFREGPFRKIVGNDELVFNGPGVNVPMISLSRYPYPEYHTSDDCLQIISKERLAESRGIVMEILEILDSDYAPKRKFKGPVFLSGYGLWVDWRVNKALNENIEDIMLRMEGDKTLFDIAEELDMEYNDVLGYVNRFLENGLAVSSKEPSKP